MTSPLLETKLHVPRRRRGLVARPRLSERLSRGAESALTVVSAPAGFGKTTLLDQRDNDPTVFWTYLVAALQTAAHGVGAGALSLLQSPRPPIEAVLATLLNDLGAVSNDVVLVLDDYHVIDARDVQDGMAFLLEHLPPQIHLVIASRADPALPLARLRARGELVEIRAADLRFTPDEAAAYLNEVMGLALTARDVAALEGRTEGWIAALQLAALSMQGRDDVAGFIAGFAGDDRYIVDYLIEEVLQRQSEDVRNFLLQTSILGRLSGPLCDAVTRRDGGKAMLEALDRGNLFLVPLDDRREWYRYHHLFADVLLARLLDEQPDQVPDLHRRASEWYEQNGELSEAIRHALAGGDFERAADLIEVAIPALRRGRQEVTLRRWLETLPDELIRARPVLNVGYVGALMVSGELDGVEGRLLDAERWLDASAGAMEGPDVPSAATVVVDEEQLRRLPAEIAIYRAALARALGDVAGTVTYARRALDLLRDDDHLGRGAAAGFLGLVHWTSGDLEAAHQSWATAMASLLKAGHVSDAIGCSIALADIRTVQGRLREATSIYERGLELAAGPGEPALRGAADMHVGLSEVHRERNDLAAAAQHLRQSQELGEHAGLAQNRYRWCVATARMREAEGDLDGALDLLDDAERLYVSDYFPNVRPIAALKARVWVAEDRWAEALGWAREQGLSADDDLSYLREFEHVTLARALLARSRRTPADGSWDEAMALLDRLLDAAEQGQRGRSVIEILVLQALAHEARRDVRAAVVPLERAVALAEPEGYVRVFVDEGGPIALLLEDAARRRLAPRYARQLLAALGRTTARAPVQEGLIEPLSQRELEVLRLLGTDLGGPEIANQLVVSLNTVRTHTRNIYAKLGVSNRRAAVRRAEELDLLTRSRSRP